MSVETKRGQGLLGRLKSALGEPDHEGADDRRRSKRVKLPIPVRLRIGNGEPESRRLHDFSQHGLFIETPDEGPVGEKVVVRFEGYPDVCEPFALAGEVLRVSEEPKGLVILIDRQSSPPEALGQFRTLALHYIRHKPLLEELDRGYFEGRCTSCDWVGRVGERNPTCARCGQPAVPIDAPR